MAEGDDPILDTASYHCQQAAEKALKCWLSMEEIPFPKTHLLGHLLDLCVLRDPAFEAFRDHCQILTPLATEFRYPGDFFEPSLQEFETACRMADEIISFVQQRMLPEQ